MRALVELSAEHPTLPAAELAAAAETLGGALVEADGSAAILELPEGAAQQLARRLALAHQVSAHWFSTAATPRALVPQFALIDLKGATFAIRARRLGGRHPEFPLSDTVRAIGGLLSSSGKVDLAHPEIDIRILLSEQAHAGALVADVDRKALDARHPSKREHFAPVSILPRYARALVNLARVRPGDRVADPFAGTGGHVIEAALLGARVYASDLDARMVEGMRAQLAAYGIGGARIEERDVGELPDWTGGGLDAIVTDPPYGRSSTTNREGVHDLYDRFFAAAHEALRPGGRLAMIVADEELRRRAAARFRPIESHDQRVHRSMTRHWGVFVRDG